MSDKVQFGKIIQGEAFRDAVHVAIAPVVAADKLQPGAHVGFVGPALVGRCEKTIGIVDPFLNVFVNPGERFYLFLYPGTITSLRHEWTHPAFEAVTATESDKAASMCWMEAFAARHHEPYRGSDEYGPGPACTAGQLIQAGKDFLLHGERMVQQGDQSLRDDVHGKELREFWKHFAVITGMTVPHDTENPFCCTC